MSAAFPLPPRYAATGKIFTGGQGTVHIYKDQALKRNVAVKLYSPGRKLNEVLDEIRIHQRARSKHIAQLYDVLINPAGDSVALISEFIDGPDFSTPPTEFRSRDGALKMLYQISSGIADLHLCGVIHRDIKPINMKIDQERIVKIFDFGISCLEANAETVAARGSLGFRAPELYQTAPIRFGASVDVYALGVTALFLLTGTLPHEFMGTPPALKSGHSYFSPLQLLAGDADLVSVLDRALDPKPGRRPSAGEIRTVLHKKLTFGKHTSRLGGDVAPYTLDAKNTACRIPLPRWGPIGISYDGIDFMISECSVEIRVNGILAGVGYVLPASCVIVVGGGTGYDRYFITFDSSHPEVVL